MITKKMARQALVIYDIPFGFPDINCGETITCWEDLYKRNGDTEKLRKAILADDNCPFTISDIPANYLASLRLAIR